MGTVKTAICIGVIAAALAAFMWLVVTVVTAFVQVLGAD